MKPRAKHDITFTAIRSAFGNGNMRTGHQLMEAIAQRLTHARTAHPTFAEGPWQALGVIQSEMDEFTYAVEYESPSRQIDEALDVIATLIRYINREHGFFNLEAPHE